MFCDVKKKKKDSMKRFDSNFVYRSFALDRLPHKHDMAQNKIQSAEIVVSPVIPLFYSLWSYLVDSLF